jgi:hypothetical protein
MYRIVGDIVNVEKVDLLKIHKCCQYRSMLTSVDSWRGI